MSDIKRDSFTEKIIGCAMRVHSALGPGLLESAYQTCLYYELVKSGLNVEKQKPMPLVYDGVHLDIGYRIDLLVEDNGREVVIELKAVKAFTDIHFAQIITYLKLSGVDTGLLINFNVKSLSQGIKRFVN